MNDTRFKVLAALEGQGNATARELAEPLGVRHEAMGMLLLRARRDGLTGYRGHRQEDVLDGEPFFSMRG